MRKKDFATTTFNPKYETFIIHVVSLNFVISFSFTSLDIDIHSFYKSQIANLRAKKALIKISTKYTDIADIFSLDLASKLPKHTEINNYAIKLVNS